MNRQAMLTCCAALLAAASALAQELETAEEKAIKAAVAEAAASVVRIETVGGLEKVGRSMVGTGPTTGLVVSEDGFVVSSAFNFVQQPTSILVTVPGGEERLPAEIVARDRSRALVLLKINPQQPLKVPQAVPREELVVGQWTIALGRTFSAEGVSMSAGVLSAAHRIWGKAIQTDAKVSPANYGGPLVDIRGRVIGVLVPMSPARQRRHGRLGMVRLGHRLCRAAGRGDEAARHVARAARISSRAFSASALKGTDIYSMPAEGCLGAASSRRRQRPASRPATR